MQRARALAVLAVAFAACSSPQPAPTSPPHVSATRSTTPVSSGGCFSRIMSVQQDASWTYVVVSNLAPKTSYTDTIGTVASDGFTVTTTFPDLTKKVEWSCSSDGLTALQFGGGESASLSTSGSTAAFKTTNVTGVTIPPNPRPGDTWSQSFDISGTQDFGGATANTKGTIGFTFSAKGVESVTVPAGGFDALAVDEVVKFSLTVNVAGVSQDVSSTFDGTSWFADGVGMVKSVSSGSIAGGGKIESTIELTNSSIPSPG